MHTVSLENLTNELLVLNLPSDLVPEHSSMAVMGVRDHDVKSGERSLRGFKKRISGSVTLLAGAKVEGLSPTIKRAPDVRAALNAHPPRVKVTDVHQNASPAPDPAQDAAPATSTPAAPPEPPPAPAAPNDPPKAKKSSKE